MRRLMALAATALVFVGCGAGAPSERPDDFAFSFSYMQGSLPPPAHYEWDLTVSPNGTATYEYTPDYPDAGVPVYTEEFTLDDGELDSIYSAMREADVLADFDGGEPTTGGATQTASITAGGETYEVPAFADGTEQPLDAVLEEVGDLVPAEIGEDIERRADRYAEKEYGGAP